LASIVRHTRWGTTTAAPEIWCKRNWQKLLDIGCGWGGLARHAALNYVCPVTGITISKAQEECASPFVPDFVGRCHGCVGKCCWWRLLVAGAQQLFGSAARRTDVRQCQTMAWRAIVQNAFGELLFLLVTIG
jgi:hypothetical protein